MVRQLIAKIFLPNLEKVRQSFYLIYSVDFELVHDFVVLLKNQLHTNCMFFRAILEEIIMFAYY